MAPRAPPKRRFLTDEEYEEEQLLLDLEAELQQVRTLRAQNRQRLEQLTQEQKALEQQQHRLQRQNERQRAGAATARMLQLQDKERERFAAAEVERQRQEREEKLRAEEASRRRENAIETDGDLDDLDAFLTQDAAMY